jgi:preprotein translocase subunit SecE
MNELLTIVEVVLGMMIALTLVAYILATAIRRD